VIRILDGINEWTGKLLTWVVVLLTLVVVFGVFTRYVLNNEPIWVFDTTTHIYGFHFIMLIGYTLLYKGHVAVDVIYRRFSAKKQAIIDIFTHTCFFFPWVGVMMWQSTVMAMTSWERMETAFGLFSMPFYPLKTAILIGFILIFLQGIATLSRSVTVLLPSKKGGEIS